MLALEAQRLPEKQALIEAVGAEHTVPICSCYYVLYFTWLGT